MAKLTKAQLDLLKIAGREFRPEDGWQPRFDHAHSKHIPALLLLRSAGLNREQQRCLQRFDNAMAKVDPAHE